MIGGARVAAAMLAVLAGAALAHAAETMRTEVRTSTDEITRAQYPELTEIEWLRFEGLMRGPRGYWTPNLDPVTTLGVHAHTDAERKRYAEITARLEHERIAGELAFAVAYAEAWRRLYPEERFGAAPPASPLPVRSPDGDRPLAVRLMLFVDGACCSQPDFLAGPLAQARALAGTAPDVGLDVYVVGAADEAAVRAWADRQRVGRTTVAVTLQPDAGTLAQASALAGVQSPRLPVLLRRERGLAGERIVPAAGSR